MSLTEREKEIARTVAMEYGFDESDIIKAGYAKSMIEAMHTFLSRIREEQEPFAYATFDGEGGYELRLHEGNESYQEYFIKRNPNYIDWVSPLFTTPPAAPYCPRRQENGRMSSTAVVCGNSSSDVLIKKIQEIGCSELVEVLEKWSYEGALQTFDSREKFRSEAKKALANHAIAKQKEIQNETK